MYGLVVHDDAIVAYDTVVAVGIVRIEGDIGVDVEIGELLLQQAEGTLRKAVRVESFFRGGGFQVIGGLGEDHQAVHAARACLGDVAEETGLPAETVDTGHGTNGDVVFSIVYEHGEDEVGRAEMGLGEPRPEGRVFAVAARAGRHDQGRHLGSALRGGLRHRGKIGEDQLIGLDGLDDRLATARHGGLLLGLKTARGGLLRKDNLSVRVEHRERHDGQAFLTKGLLETKAIDSSL
mmetsp:Transcript_23446/g.39230  ORF Transcript_23446/g.39230 Transcript_23446/m.39230 type:complete len:236 (-) Transcript_23446:29-736(-)